MANEKNLIPAAHKLTVEEASKGGKMSAKKRRAKKSFREAVKWVLEMETNAVIDDENTKITQYQLLAMNLFQEAKDTSNKNHLDALRILADLAGESARQLEIQIKEKELQLKKDVAENNNSW